MASVTVRINVSTRDKVREISEREQQPMHEVIEKAIEEYRRRRFLEEVNAAYAALKADPEAWREELEERAAWDATLADGLEDE
jgi:predicted transcriptional regulator